MDTITIHTIKRVFKDENGCKRNSYIINKDGIKFHESISGLIELRKYGEMNTYGPAELQGMLGVFLIEKEMVDNGDYDYEDVYQPDYEEEISYYPINYDPVTGQKIKIVIDKILDVQEEYDRTYEEYSVYYSTHKRKNEAFYQQLNELSNKINKFYQNLFVDTKMYEKIKSDFKDKIE